MGEIKKLFLVPTKMLVMLVKGSRSPLPERQSMTKKKILRPELESGPVQGTNSSSLRKCQLAPASSQLANATGHHGSACAGSLPLLKSRNFLRRIYAAFALLAQHKKAMVDDGIILLYSSTK